MRYGVFSLMLAMTLVVACAPAAPSPTAPPPKPTEAPKPAAKPAEAPKPAVKPTEAPAAKPAEAKPAASPAAKPAEKPAAKPLTPIKTVALELNPTPDPIVAWVDVTQELGLFEKNGLQVEIKRSGGGGPAKVQALVAGEADIAVSDIIAGFSGVYEGTDVRTIFVPTARYGWIIAAKKKYTQVPQLKGQLVGVPSLGGSSRFGGILTFKAFGIADQDVKWQAVGGTAQMLAAQFSGRTEAAVLSPTAVPLIKGPDAADTHVLVPNTAKHTPPFPNFVIIARNKWVQENPEAAERYVKAFVDMGRQLAKDQQAFVRVARKFLPEMTNDEAAALWKTVTDEGFWSENGGINLAATQELLNTYFEVRGDKPNDKLAKAADTFNTGPLKRVLDREKVIETSKDKPDWYKP
ncbi:MAG: ABC transporter substrate-binding protein [Planctomycetes bacterium]|nr:ABC transporter substrate-binding protein [Planctomycetota bacterium]